CHVLDPRGNLRWIGRRAGDEYDFIDPRVAVALEVIDGDSFEIGCHDYLDLLRVTAALAQHRMQSGNLRSGLSRVEVEPEPPVTDIGDPPEGGAAFAAEQHRQVSATNRFRERARPVEVDELAVKTRDFFTPQPPHHLDVFAGALRAPPEWNTQRRKFLGRPSHP